MRGPRQHCPRTGSGAGTRTPDTRIMIQSGSRLHAQNDLHPGTRPRTTDHPATYPLLADCWQRSIHIRLLAALRGVFLTQARRGSGSLGPRRKPDRHARRPPGKGGGLFFALPQRQPARPLILLSTAAPTARLWIGAATSAGDSSNRQAPSRATEARCPQGWCASSLLGHHGGSRLAGHR